MTLGSLMLLVTYTQQLIGVALLLAAVLYLSRMKTNPLSAIIDM
jgi:hypothetical protein